MLRNRWVRFGLLASILALVLGGLIWGASQPWTANHFGYALPGKDGLPAYIYANGRRYQSAQVCAGAGWCDTNRATQNVPRCFGQANLARFNAWPVVKVAEMTTFFGAPQPIFVPAGGSRLTGPFVMSDGTDCYVMYSLEGGP